MTRVAVSPSLQFILNTTILVFWGATLSAAVAGDPVFVTSKPNGGWSTGGYYVHNNMWNSAKYHPCTSTQRGLATTGKWWRG